MAITVKCPQCSSKLTAPDERAGKRGRCPSCGAIVRIPMAPAPAGPFDSGAAPRADLGQRADRDGGAAKRAVESSGGAGDGGRRARLGLLIGGGVLAAGVVLAVALLRGKETPEPKPGLEPRAAETSMQETAKGEASAGAAASTAHPAAAARREEYRAAGWEIVGFQGEPFHATSSGQFVISLHDGPHPLRVRIRLSGGYAGLPEPPLHEDFAFYNKAGRRLPVYTIQAKYEQLEAIAGDPSKHAEISVILCETSSRFVGFNRQGFPINERGPGDGFPPGDVLVSWKAGEKLPLAALAANVHAPMAETKQHALARLLAEGLRGAASDDAKPEASARPKPTPKPKAAPPRPKNLRHTLTGHTADVCSVAFSPDGHLLASAAEDGTVRLWNPRSGKPVRTLRVAPEPVRVDAAAFSPDGNSLAVGWNKLMLCDPRTGKAKWTATPPALTKRDAFRHIGSLAFSPDGRTIATGPHDADGVVDLWDAATGKRMQSLLGFRKSVDDLAFSPDGKMLAGASTRTTHVLVWDLPGGDVRHELSTGDNWGFKAVAFSPDGRRLAAAHHAHEVRVYDIRAGRLLKEIRVGALLGVVYSPDGKHLATAAGGSGSVVIWDAATGKERITLAAQGGWDFDLAFSPDGRTLATGGSDDAVKLWDVGALND